MCQCRRNCPTNGRVAVIERHNQRRQHSCVALPRYAHSREVFGGSLPCERRNVRERFDQAEQMSIFRDRWAGFDFRGRLAPTARFEPWEDARRSRVVTGWVRFLSMPRRIAQSLPRFFQALPTQTRGACRDCACPTVYRDSFDNYFAPRASFRFVDCPAILKQGLHKRFRD